MTSISPARLPLQSTIGVIVAGTMGQDIAALALRAGHPVSLHDARDEALEAASQAIDTALARWVRRGDMSADDQATCTARLTLVSDQAMLKGVNYPVGPLAWADRYGNANVVQVLDNLAKIYPDGRYRASALLRRKAATCTPWIEPLLLGGKPQ